MSLSQVIQGLLLSLLMRHGQFLFCQEFSLVLFLQLNKEENYSDADKFFQCLD